MASVIVERYRDALEDNERTVSNASVKRTFSDEYLRCRIFLHVIKKIRCKA